MTHFRATRVLEVVFELSPDDVEDHMTAVAYARLVAESLPETEWTIVHEEVEKA